MTGPIRKPTLDRTLALLAGPFLLGRQALSLAFLPDEDAPPEASPETALRITVTPPEHAIKRRG
jgi:hypothetical protein